MENLAQIDGVQRLRDAGARFAQTYQHFAMIPPELRPANYESVRMLADTTRRVISDLTRAVDTAAGWAGAAFGLKAQDAFGIFPDANMLATGTIGAGVSAIMLANSRMQGVINEALAAQARRGDDSDHPAPVALGETGSIFGNAELWAIIGGAAIFVLPKFLESLREGD